MINLKCIMTIVIFRVLTENGSINSIKLEHEILTASSVADSKEPM